MPKSSAGSTGLAVLFAGFFLIDFDLVVINPLLLPIAEDFGVGLGTVTFALTAYLLLFGAMQPVHGSLSDTVGRVKVMRIALLGLGAGNLIAAAAPNVAVVIAGRAVAGAFGAAMIPLTLAYIGDRVAPQQRQRAMAGLLASGAVGGGLATILAGLLTDLVSWRPAVLLVGLAAPVLALLYGRLPETVTVAAGGPGALRRIGAVSRGGWFRFLLVFTFVEGAAMLGFFNFFNAALQADGRSVVVAGVVTGSYGLAALAGGALVGLIETRVSQAAMFAIGGTLLFAGFAVAAYSQSLGGILAASVLAGMALSLGQSTIQTWGVEVAAPGTLGTVASLVACAVFTGAAVGTAAVTGLANAGDFGTLFAIAAAVTLPVTVVGALARARFARSTATDGPATLDTEAVALDSQ
ncbi:MFS transporter [Dactylosporangium aurantiacum]|uniref:MFS transporter n=1 Tax=Dactylosporangium aurantiacum TaxID=35754 RepID=A0A9Q9MIB0_9ACTN|nr:MFS transporter [Dactylosporangium aurantiacum]MDG6106643.1 MFS transporter [Dactylosporangium aurantiacum]UWZ50802.1 MFS transporter [Dactylosporangium aurantiacum]